MYVDVLTTLASLTNESYLFTLQSRCRENNFNRIEIVQWKLKMSLSCELMKVYWSSFIEMKLVTSGWVVDENRYSNNDECIF